MNRLLSKIFPNMGKPKPPQGVSSLELPIGLTYAERETNKAINAEAPDVTLRFELCSITKVKADAIVNSTNTLLIAGGGLDWAIHKAAGPEMQEDLKAFGECGEGNVVVTSGYNLACTRVFHAVTPSWGPSDDKSPMVIHLLRSCYREIFRLAEEHECSSVAIPAIGTGAHEIPLSVSAQIAKEEYIRFFYDEDENCEEVNSPRHIKEIIFVLNSNEAYETYTESFSSFRAIKGKVRNLDTIYREFQGKKISLKGDFLVTIVPSSTNIAIGYFNSLDFEFIDITVRDDDLVITNLSVEEIAITLLCSENAHVDYQGKGLIVAHGDHKKLVIDLKGGVLFNSTGKIDDLLLRANINGEILLNEIEFLSIEVDGEYEVSAKVLSSFELYRKGFGDVYVQGAPKALQIKDEGVGALNLDSN